jgi:hypothetical protein
MVNYKKHVALISLGILSLLLISTTIFIHYNAGKGEKENIPDNPHKNGQIHKKPSCKGIECPKGNIPDNTVSPTDTINGQGNDEANDEKDDCGCHCSDFDNSH